VDSLNLAPTATERLRSLGAIARFTLGHSKKLIRDVLIAIEHAVLGHPAAVARAPSPASTSSASPLAPARR
jgi:hypothetical protein